MCKLTENFTVKNLRHTYYTHQGDLYWRDGRFAGKLAGGYDNKGYRRTSHKGVGYLVHRIIYMLEHGTVPEFLDHIDGDITNNHIGNLRETTKRQNNHNRKITERNMSGVKGVSWCKAKRMWKTGICFDYKTHFAGYYKDIDDAEIAVKELRRELHGRFTNDG